MTTLENKFKIKRSTKLKFTIGGIGFNLSAGLFAAWLMNFYIKIIKIDLKSFTIKNQNLS